VELLDSIGPSTHEGFWIRDINGPVYLFGNILQGLVVCLALWFYATRGDAIALVVALLSLISLFCAVMGHRASKVRK
jgi:sterol desaturase/sphingolipid hydroxylase (fatty acid hydroxylase superfamily)